LYTTQHSRCKKVAPTNCCCYCCCCCNDMTCAAAATHCPNVLGVSCV
jgi:hypothetical protein